MFKIANSHRAVDGRVFVAEKDVVDDTSKRSQRVILVWCVFLPFQVQITCIVQQQVSKLILCQLSDIHVARNSLPFSFHDRNKGKRHTVE